MRYLNKDIWFKAPLIKPKITLSNNYFLVGKNRQTKWSITPNARIISHNYYVHDLKELREFESFFNDKKARVKSFFIPSHTKDIISLKAPNGVTSFKAISSNKPFWIYNQARHLIFDRKFASQILDIKQIQDYEEIVLKDPLPFEIDKNTLIEELINVRFNRDEIEFIKSGAVGFKTSLDFKEVFYEV